jgi:hypothetical protein
LGSSCSGYHLTYCLLERLANPWMSFFGYGLHNEFAHGHQNSCGKAHGIVRGDSAQIRIAAGALLPSLVRAVLTFGSQSLFLDT